MKWKHSAQQQVLNLLRHRPAKAALRALLLFSSTGLTVSESLYTCYCSITKSSLSFDSSKQLFKLNRTFASENCPEHGPLFALRA